MTEANKDILARPDFAKPWACSANNRKLIERYANTRRHTIVEDPGPFRKLALSSDGNTLVAVARRVLCLFNTRTRERLDRVVFDSDIEHVVINSDGQIVFVADATNTVHVIDVSFTYRSQVVTYESDIVAMAVDSTGSRLAIADVTSSINLLDTNDFQNTPVPDCGFRPQRLVIRNDEDMLLAYGLREIVVYRLSTVECLARYGNNQQVEESFCLTDEHLIAEAPGGFVVFDVATAEFRFVPARTYEAYDATPDGSVFTTAHLYGLTLWDTSRGAEIRQVRTYIREINDIKICDEGQVVYVCGDDAIVDCYSVRGERLATYSDFYSPIMAAATTHADRTLVVADESGSLAVYDLVTGVSSRFHQHTCCISKLFVEGSLVATGAHDGWARVLDLDTGKQEFGVNFPGSPVQAVTLDGDRFLAIGNYLGQVQLYDLDTHKLVREFHGNRCTIRSLSISPCRRYLMSTNESGEALIFDYESGELTNQLKGYGTIYSGCFDESGEFVYFGDDHGWIVKARPNSLRASKRWHIHSSSVRSIHIRGDKLTSIGISDKAQVLDLKTGQTILDCPVNTKPYHRVAFMNASGTRLVTGGQDGCLMFRDVTNGSILAELHNLAHGFLWLTRDDEATKDYGDCFWTDQEALISVYNRVAGIETLLVPSSEEYKEYVRIHKNQSMTMTRVGMTPAAIDESIGQLLEIRRNSIMDWDPFALLEQLPG